MKAKRLAGVLCTTLLMGSMLAGCSGTQDAPAPQQEAVVVGVPVEVQEIVVQDYERIVTVGGMTTAESTVNVIAKVNGMEQIEAVNVKVGDHVTKGEVLAVLNSDLSAIQLSNAQMAYDDAARNYEQNKVLFEAGALSQVQMDQLEMALRSAENTLASAQLAQDYATVVAPISGSIVSCNADEGSYASAQAPMFVIANVDNLEIKTGISESYVNKVKVGQTVDVIISAAETTSFKAKVKEIGKVMDMNTKNYPITITMNNKDGKIMAGMYAEIKLMTDRADGSIVVPAETIINRDEKRFVFVEQDGKSFEREIQTGLSDGNSYVVTEGLAVGERLIVKGNKDLVDGEAVVVVNRPKTEDASAVSEDAKAPATDSDEAKRGDQQ